jgi:hypothetical protein
MLRRSKGFGKRFTLTSKRKVTGERALFVKLYERQGGRCAVTGCLLLPPSHHHFHLQGSHLLPKGSYRRARLWEDNVVMVTASQHALWEVEKNKDKLVQIEPRWAPIVERYHALKLAYNTGTR